MEAALTAASKTSFCTDAYVKAGINAIALASATVTRIRRIRAAEIWQSMAPALRATRTADDSQSISIYYVFSQYTAAVPTDDSLIYLV